MSVQEAGSPLRWRLSSQSSPAVVWHDVECAAYTADLPLWRRLADGQDGAVLEIGAGTGRVALDLAVRGHTVVALDRERELLDELARRAGLLERHRPGCALLSTVQADARRFDLGQKFGLIVVPMQMIQLLDGAASRAEFLACAVRHLEPGATLALALTEQFDLYDSSARQPGKVGLPPPDVRDVSGTLFRSQPTAVRLEGESVVLERRREQLRADRSRLVESDRLTLDLISPERLESEGGAVGLRAGDRVDVPPTPDHVGSVVVMLHA